MSQLVAKVKNKIPNCCQAKKCDKDGCRLCLNDTPDERVLIDMDCTSLGIKPNETRCDYLFVCQLDEAVWVAPIELKSGGIGSVSVISGQLQAGAKMVDKWLPPSTDFQLRPVLAHGRSIHRNDLKKLRKTTIKLRGKRAQINILKCRERLTKALNP